MLSRVADSLYWMSRYLERAEHTARLIDVDLQLRLEQAPEVGAGHWSRLIEALEAPLPPSGTVDAASITQILTLDRSNGSSILSCVAAARENLRQVREQCSSEMWEQLNRLYLQVNSTTAGEAWLLNSHVFFRAVQEGAHLFQGVTDSTMLHGEGWRYIQLGRFVERTDLLARLVRTHFASRARTSDAAIESEEYLEWVGLLKSCSAFEAYCKTYTAELRPVRIAEFVLLNPEFPHSVRFSVDRIDAALQSIGELTERRAEQPIRLAGRLQATLSFSQIDEIMGSGASGYVDGVRWQCAQVHNAIQQVYFDYAIEQALVS
ncbi:MAG TPA: alpha-E domain-containing protein [Candidatus Sulfotelmatobacter sp.]|nr:alpha-E domain-containing protein [Candidatus Sulfotelmatobacter sp.]